MGRFWIQNTIMLSLVLFFFFTSSCFVSSQNDSVDGPSRSGHERVQVGLVLDLGSMDGKMVRSSISMALSDFYAVNSDYRTRVSLSFRDSRGEPLLALASAEDLLQTVGVKAIIVGQSLLETKFLAEIGEKARVPVISINSPSSKSLNKYNYLIQATHDPTSEAKGITSFIHGFNWNNVALVYEDDDDWRESMQLMVDHFHEKDIRIRSKQGFTIFSREDFLMDRLQKLRDLGITIFVVHMSERIATHLFSCAEKLGMMGEGFAWILTVKTMNSFHEDFSKETMEGVVGFKSYIPISKELHNFTLRWRKSQQFDEQVIGWLSIFVVWAHDIAVALARAVEVARMPNVSSTLLEAITESRFKGFSGDFKLDDKKLLSNKFEIVNMMGSSARRVGFWNSNGSFSSRRRRHLSSTHNNLETIIWPGGSAEFPKGSGNPRESSIKKLKVLVTSSNRFQQLMNVTTNHVTNVTSAKGFCIEVFEAAIKPFNYVPEYIRWLNGSNYDDLAYALYSQKDKYDVAVGDITITPNRSTFVDFTIPFTEMGVGIVALNERSMWVFLEPLTPNLWITSAAFFFLTGIIVWLIERSENTEFQGSWSQQIGVVLWFGFSTLVYAHRERLRHNLSRFVVIVWVFAVLILTTSYTATLTSMVTVQQIRFNSNKDYVGHLSGSFVAHSILNAPDLNKMRTKGLNTSADYVEALLNKNVSHIIDELPYLKVILAQRPAQILMLKRQCTTNGFAFMFQKGSELAQNVSREIARLRTMKTLDEMEKKYFENKFLDPMDYTSNPLTLSRFRGLFMVVGISFAFALTLLFILGLREKWEVIVNSVKIFLLRRFRQFKILVARTIHPNPLDGAFGENAVQMAQRS